MTFSKLLQIFFIVMTVYSNMCLGRPAIFESGMYREEVRLIKFHSCAGNDDFPRSGFVVLPDDKRSIEQVKKILVEVYDEIIDFKVLNDEAYNKTLGIKVINYDGFSYISMFRGLYDESWIYLLFNGAFMLMSFYDESEADVYLRAEGVSVKIVKDDSFGALWCKLPDSVTPETHDIALLELDQVDIIKALKDRWLNLLPDFELTCEYNDGVKEEDEIYKIVVYREKNKSPFSFKAVMAGVFSYAVDRDRNGITYEKPYEVREAAGFNMKDNVSYVRTCLEMLACPNGFETPKKCEEFEKLEDLEDLEDFEKYEKLKECGQLTNSEDIEDFYDIQERQDIEELRKRPDLQELRNRPDLLRLKERPDLLKLQELLYEEPCQTHDVKKDGDLKCQFMEHFLFHQLKWPIKK